MKTFLLALVVLGIFSAISDAQDVTVFQHARLIDGTGAPPRDDTTIVVRGHTIESVGTDIAIPAGATLIDARGKTIMPALVVAHAHLGLVQGTSSSTSHITEANVLHQLYRYANYGIGTITSLGLDHELIFDLRQQRDQHELVCPRILTAGHGFTAPQGGPGASIGDQLYRPATVEEARKDVVELAGKHPDIVKIWLDDFGGSSKRIQPEIYKAIIDEAHKHGLRVAAHIYYLADAKAIVEAGVDILAHSIRDLPVDDELIHKMRDRGVFLIPTLDMIEVSYVYADKPAWMKEPFFTNAAEPGVVAMLESPKYAPQNRDRRVLKLAEQNLKILFDANVKIGFGTDTGAAPIRVQGFGEHRELQLMVEAGLTPMQAIQCATQHSAELLGIWNTVGTLEPGKEADLIVLDADPSVDIHNTERINAVWLDGKKVDADSQSK
ncbi:MAG TPA: amidohydrolase family protein [Tepidisphaeraceae bacterium]|jgi:imidazolonepropionase-like amidohydrolase|nr:amidohydrolase family protein [Tepidisphaeraceae bacterium]